MQTLARDNQLTGAVATAHAGSVGARWTGRALRGLAVAFLIFDGVGKLLEVQPVVDGTRQLGYPPDIVFGLGVTLLTCVLAYLVPRTSVVGAVLLTAYLGGAVATHVRVGSPILTHVLFPTYIAALVWGSLVLRDARLRAFLPWRERGH
jgi:hypothetical protein